MSGPAAASVGVTSDPAGDANSTDAELAERLVRDAGLLALRMARNGLTVDRKSSVSDVVSDADRAAEAMIVGRLALARPDDGLVGEEGAAAPGRRTWYIDPVDGTYNYVSGLPAWCSAVALADRDELLVGAVYQPATDETWVGGPGLPTTRNGLRVEPIVDGPQSALSLCTYLSPSSLADPGFREPLLRAVRQAASVRILGSGSVELAATAASRLGVWLHADTLSWDWLPGAALVVGAGGVIEVFQAHGHRWHVAGPATAVREAKAAIVGGREG